MLHHFVILDKKSQVYDLRFQIKDKEAGTKVLASLPLDCRARRSG